MWIESKFLKVIDSIKSTYFLIHDGCNKVAVRDELDLRLMRSKDKDLDLKILVHLEERVEYERG